MTGWSGRDRLVLEGGRDRHDLGGRAGLEDVADRLVDEAALGPADVVGVEGRVGRQREDLAGLGVHDDRRARLRTHLGHPLGQGVLGVPLDVGVDGEGDVLAVDRPDAALASAGDLGAVRRLLEHRVAGLALEGLVHHRLEATTGLAVVRDVADERGGGRALRVDALGHRLGGVLVDAGDAELGDLAPGQRADLAVEHLVAPGPGEHGPQVGGAPAEQRARARRRRRPRRPPLVAGSQVFLFFCW